jgi:hypothetical protein
VFRLPADENESAIADGNLQIATGITKKLAANQRETRE